MPTPQDELLQAFNDAVEAFNSADHGPKPLLDLLDDGVSYNPIHNPNNPNAAVSGRQNVRDQLVDRARKVNAENKRPFEPNEPPKVVDPNTGIVSGDAIWNRVHNTPTPPARKPITFRFEFVRNAQNQWVLKRMSGQ